MARSASAPPGRGCRGHAQDTPIAVDSAEYHMLGPVTLDRGRSRWDSPPSDHPGGGQVALLAKIGPEHPHIEVLWFHSPKPPVENFQRRVDRYGLVIIERCPGPDRPGVDAVLPEHRSHTGPVPLGKSSGVAAEQVLDDVLVTPGARGGTVFDLTSRHRQKPDCQGREPQAAHADCRCASNCARSSSFSRRVLGVSSEKAQRTMPLGSIST